MHFTEYTSSNVKMFTLIVVCWPSRWHDIDRTSGSFLRLNPERNHRLEGRFDRRFAQNIARGVGGGEGVVLWCTAAAKHVAPACTVMYSYNKVCWTAWTCKGCLSLSCSTNSAAHFTMRHSSNHNGGTRPALWSTLAVSLSLSNISWHVESEDKLRGALLWCLKDAVAAAAIFNVISSSFCITKCDASKICQPEPIYKFELCSAETDGQH
jgi:hypothetical protein